MTLALTMALLGSLSLFAGYLLAVSLMHLIERRTGHTIARRDLNDELKGVARG